MIAIRDTQIQQVERMLGALPGAAERAYAGIINRAIDTVRTEVTRAVKSVYLIDDVRAETTVRVQRATMTKQVGAVSYAGHKIPISRFHVSREPAARMRIPVKLGKDENSWRMVRPCGAIRANLMRGHKAARFDDSFLTTLKSGHLGVFNRHTRDRVPVRQMMGLSMAQMAHNTVVLEQVERAAQETIDQQVELEIGRVLDGYGRTL